MSYGVCGGKLCVGLKLYVVSSCGNMCVVMNSGIVYMIWCVFSVNVDSVLL